MNPVRFKVDFLADHIARCVGYCMAGRSTSWLNFTQALAGAVKSNASKSCKSACEGSKQVACAAALSSRPSSAHDKRHRM